MFEWSGLMDILPLLVVTGMGAGLLAGLLGVGGGIVIVPVLFFVFQTQEMSSVDAMKLAIGTSLMAIVPTAMSSVLAHHRKGNVQWALLRDWTPWMLLGVLMGVTLLVNVTSHLFTVLFAVIASWVAWRMFWGKTTAAAQMPAPWIQRVAATATGSLSVMVGIGGGTIGVALLTRFGVAIHQAVGTAATFGLIIALPGALVLLVVPSTFASPVPAGTWHAVNWLALICIVPLTVLFAPLGVKLGQMMNPALLKKVFAAVLLITSIRMFLQVVGY